MTIKVLCKRLLRPMSDMVASRLKMAEVDWTVPDHATLCLGQKTLAVQNRGELMSRFSTFGTAEIVRVA
jgi:hypothetical protein